MVELGIHLLVSDDEKSLEVTERAYLECGCQVFVGRRMDNMEAATGAMPCTPAHLPLIEAFNVLLVETLEAPTHHPLVNVASVLLDVAAKATA